MNQFPFPAYLAAQSARTGRRLQASAVDDAGRRRGRGPLPSPYTAHGVAAYFWPDGRVGLSHDMYAPTHPEGTEPGLARVHYAVEHYPNDSSGYRAQVLEFMGIPRIEAEIGARIERTAAAMLIRDQEAHVVLAGSEPEMAEMLADLDPEVRVLRAPITHIDAAPGARIRRMVAINSPGGGLYFQAATFDDALHGELRERFSFLPSDPTLDGFLGALRKHATKNGWVMADVSVLDRPGVPGQFRKVVEPSPGPF